MELHTIGIDLGKAVFHLVGFDLRGEVAVHKKFSRTQLCQVCWRMSRWRNGRTRRSPNP